MHLNQEVPGRYSHPSSRVAQIELTVVQCQQLPDLCDPEFFISRDKLRKRRIATFELQSGGAEAERKTLCFFVNYSFQYYFVKHGRSNQKRKRTALMRIPLSVFKLTLIILDS